jgi:hypothetical protein
MGSLVIMGNGFVIAIRFFSLHSTNLRYFHLILTHFSHTHTYSISLLSLSYRADDFNGSSSNGMKLVFFDDAIRHVQRIVRIVRQPRGNAMLGTISCPRLGRGAQRDLGAVERSDRGQSKGW